MQGVAAIAVFIKPMRHGRGLAGFSLDAVERFARFCRGWHRQVQWPDLRAESSAVIRARQGSVPELRSRKAGSHSRRAIRTVGPPGELHLDRVTRAERHGDEWPDEPCADGEAIEPRLAGDDAVILRLAVQLCGPRCTGDGADRPAPERPRAAACFYFALNCTQSRFISSFWPALTKTTKTSPRAVAGTWSGTAISVHLSPPPVGLTSASPSNGPV